MITSETVCHVGTVETDPGTNLHLNLPDLGVVVDGVAVNPTHVLASAADFKRLFKPWALGLAKFAAGGVLSDAIERFGSRSGLVRTGRMPDRLKSVSIEAEPIAPVPHDTRPQRRWRSAREMLDAFTVLDRFVCDLLGVPVAWFGLPQIIPAYIHPTVDEHHQMRCSLNGWYAGVPIGRCQAFYWHFDGPQSKEREDWISAALAMHYGSMPKGQVLTVFLSPIFHGLDSEGAQSPTTVSGEMMAEDLVALHLSPCPVRVVWWFHANDEARLRAILGRIEEMRTFMSEQMPQFRVWKE